MPNLLYQNEQGNNLYYSGSDVIFAHILNRDEDDDVDLFLVVSQMYGSPAISFMVRGQLEALLNCNAQGWTVAMNDDEVIFEDHIEENNRRHYIDFKDFYIGPSDRRFHSHLTPIPIGALPDNLQEIAAATAFIPDHLMSSLNEPDGPGFYYVYESPDNKWLNIIRFIPNNYPSFDLRIIPNTFYNRWTRHLGFVGWSIENNNGHMFKVDYDSPDEVLQWEEPGERFFLMMLDLLGLMKQAYFMSSNPASEIAEPEWQYLINLVDSLPVQGKGDEDMAKLGNATLRQLQPLLDPNGSAQFQSDIPLKSLFSDQYSE